MYKTMFFRFFIINIFMIIYGYIKPLMLSNNSIKTVTMNSILMNNKKIYKIFQLKPNKSYLFEYEDNSLEVCNIYYKDDKKHLEEYMEYLNISLETK